MSRTLMYRLLLMALAATAFGLATSAARAEVVGFEDIGASLPPESYWNGSALPEGDHPFASGGVSFDNHFNYDYTWGFPIPYWDGFAYANSTDNADYGGDNWQHQFNVMPASGDAGSPTYGISYLGYQGRVPTVYLPEGALVESVKITNTVYDFYSMLSGSPFTLPFGGTDGNRADWLLLMITGRDSTGGLLGSIPFYLADYRSPNNTEDYIVRDWTLVNLASLAGARTLAFELSTSDNDPIFGPNTPMYFAIDDLVLTQEPPPPDPSGVPEPSAMLLAALAGLALGIVRRTRRG